jgi:hypothetical protein
MPELTPEDRRTALNFASALEFMAAGIPNDFVRKGAHRLIRQIRMRYRFSIVQKKDYIVKIVRVTNGGGGVSIADLIKATGWHKDEIYDLVKEIENETPPRLELRKIPPAGMKGGRPALLIFALEVPSFSPPPPITTP